jgi:threonine/homoserine/homoserine lactone efflux protein
VGDGDTVAREAAEPLSLWQALVFQYVNPKAWVFVLAAVTAFRPEGLSVAVGTALMAVTMMAVVVPCATLWAAAGGVLSNYLADQRRSRWFRLAMGVLLAATVVYIWI